MTDLIIKSHKSGVKYKTHHLFILNKGLNSGKPLNEACPNCFVIIFTAESEAEAYYWLAYSLWKSKYWHPFLVGSVIPFLRLYNFKYEFTRKTATLITEQEQHLKHVATLKLLQLKETQFHQNLALISDMRRVILHRYINKM